MPRTARRAPGGTLFHALNRGVGRRTLFHKDEDYAAFERVMSHALAAVPVRLLAYCLMPNHWHLILWPVADGDLGRFMQRLTMTHVRRWQAHARAVGDGHLYQGRFKSFPVQDGPHYLVAARYVERNALRAGLVRRAEDWPWSSLWRHAHPPPPATPREPLALADWPVPRPADWLAWVNDPQTDAEVAALRLSVAKGRPFGDPDWQQRTAARLGLASSFRPTGRPRKRAPEAAGG